MLTINADRCVSDPSTQANSASVPVASASIAAESLIAKASDPKNIPCGRRSTRVGRIVGIAFGVGTQIFFLWTAYQLFFFLRGPLHSERAFTPVLDVLMAACFAWPHSLLLVPQVQRWIKRYIEPAMMGCVHCVATCISLWILFNTWTSSNVMLWDLHGSAETLMWWLFYGSWAALLYSLWLSGMGYQTGLQPWIYWLLKKPAPRREFHQRGAYRIMRHPVYLSFLGLIWFTPHMSLDHVILTAVWTVYIYIGSYLKDKRLLFYIGQPYKEYAQRVPGFPIIGFGPLGRT